MLMEVVLVNASLAAILPWLIGLGYIQNHIRQHEYNTKNHDPRPRINNQPL